MLAGAGSRFVSAIVDFVIQFALLACLAIVLGLLGAVGFGGGAVAVGLWFVVSFLLISFYDIFFEVLNGGRTPGKAMNGLRVVRVSGHPVTFITSAIRNLIRPIDFLPSAYLVGAVVILATRKNQRIGDVVAGTLVVRDRKPGEAPAARVPVPDNARQRYAAWDTTRITQEELAAVRQFLERRGSIEYSARAELAGTLAERLRPKVGGAPENLRGEEFLAALVAAKATRPR
jgi:uncharacterized RDD family membrane protein YckC